MSMAVLIADQAVAASITTSAPRPPDQAATVSGRSAA